MKSISFSVLACALLGASAMAQSAPDAPEGAGRADTAVAAFVAAPADTAALDALRGGAEQVRNDMTLGGTVADNSARNVSTGSNTIDNGSFANMNGLPMVIQNTGANVLIQNATLIHVEMK